jgi:TIR domain-containing protein
VPHYDFDVFLSYAGTDYKLARRFVEWMRCCGIRVWIDEEQLVPASRFRAGLEQGLQESQHMVALLTESYHTRSWTQRELDLFDLDADRSERHVLAIEFGPHPKGSLDQVFLVHQRIKWQSDDFDAEAFWKLHCGLTNTRPGQRDSWAKKWA